MSKSKKRLIIIAVSVPLAFLLVFMPLSTVIIYEAIFGARHETAEWLEYSIEDFEGLAVERSDFVSDGTTLAGYKYSKNSDTVKGVVVISHGLGGGGHNTYMPFIDCFTENGYYVFAYDARGNDESGGRTVRGLPQGLIDLDSALCHVKTLEEYSQLPIVLFGHSWGGYSVGNVLTFHPDVKAAVIVAGFNESEDMLSYQGGKYAGPTVGFGMLYLDAYEKLKFGKEYADMSATRAMQNCDTGVMIIHGGQDATVPAEYGYDKMYEVFGDNDRFEFVFYEDRGHDNIFYSDESAEYREQLNADYKRYVEENGKKYNAETKAEFMNEHLDKKLCFEPDAELMERILAMYDEYCCG